MSLAQRMQATANRLVKWRSLFAGWQLGTRPLGDPECDAVRDHREITILMRAELSAFTGLCVSKGLFTTEEFQKALIDECELLEKDYEGRFPGVKATDIGLQFDERAIPWMKNWKQ